MRSGSGVVTSGSDRVDGGCHGGGPVSRVFTRGIGSSYGGCGGDVSGLAVRPLRAAAGAAAVNAVAPMAEAAAEMTAEEAVVVPSTGATAEETATRPAATGLAVRLAVAMR